MTRAIFGRLLRQLRAVPSKPLDVVTFRARQEASLVLLDVTNGWARVGRRARLAAGKLQQPGTSWVAADGTMALGEAIGLGVLQADDVDGPARLVTEHRFPLLSSTCPPLEAGKLPWHTDWRFGHRWEPAPFRSYDFYSPRNRPQPWDVRFVWELNRLGWLLPLAQAVAVGRDPDGSARAALMATISSWVEANPLARSASWQPMEASMRVINLCSIIGLLDAGGALGTDEAGLLLPLVAEHGAFVWRTREYTDVRGNHYAANVVALLLAGLALGEGSPSGERWAAFGQEALRDEVVSQLLTDGMDIEGSLPYHQLVVHLFLLGVLALERSGRAVSPAADDRLHAGARYLAAAVRADSALPAVGDDDGASAVDLDAGRRPPWRSLLAIAALRWDDPCCLAPGVELTPSAVLATGMGALQQWPALGPAPAVARYHPRGGAVAARRGGTSFWMDVGDVGLRGRGGHGHNDLGTFELAVAGVPLVVDRGSYLYTGDLAARDLFRGTASHSVAVVDGEEMAPLLGPWGIGPGAEPVGATATFVHDHVHVRVGHHGYRRLGDPVELERSVDLDLGSGRLRCEDEVVATGSHTVDRFVHFDPSCMVKLADGGAEVRANGLCCAVTWDSSATAELRTTWSSAAYGHRVAASTLVLHSLCGGTSRLWLALDPAMPEPDR